MTNSNAPIPAGWYADPAGSPRSRWWDGTQWTEHFQEPYTSAGSAAALKAPEGTPAYNVWIWLVALLPYVTLPLLFTINFGDAFSPEVLMDPERAAMAQFAIFLSPGYIAMVVLGFITTILVIFFNLVIGPVYAIGRSVIVKRRTGHGSAVLWVTIGMIVLTFVVAIVWTAVLITQITQSVTTLY